MVIYPHRPDLKELTFYQCEPCGAYVGTHKGTNKPLGILADSVLRSYRSSAHSHFDPLWRDGVLKRKEAYSELAKYMGIDVKDTHIAMFDVDQCKQVNRFSVNKGA